MPVATLTLELAIEHAQSLKDRRQVVRSLKDKLRHGFNVSVAEMAAGGWAGMRDRGQLPGSGCGAAGRVAGISRHMGVPLP